MKNITLAKKKIIGFFILGIFFSLTFINFTSAAPAYIPPSPPAPPKITKFTIDGSRGSINTMASYMTFVWETNGASSCSASASGNSSNWSGSKGVNGAEQIFTGWPGTTNYRLTCVNSAGVSTNSSVSVSLPSSTTNTSGVINNTNPNAVVCSASSIKTFKDLVEMFVSCVLSRLIYLLISVAVVVFLWGIFKFVKSEGDDKEGAKELMFWGIVGLFVIISIWGLVAIFQFALIPSGNYNITPRQVNIDTSSL